MGRKLEQTLQQHFIPQQFNNCLARLKACLNGHTLCDVHTWLLYNKKGYPLSWCFPKGLNLIQKTA